MNAKHLLIVAGLGIFVALAACGDDGAATEGTTIDGGAGDSASTADAASATDGSAPDAGVSVDGGVDASPDGGVTNDGGADGAVDVGVPRVVINEIESNGGAPGDWVELTNAGTAAADVSGWIFKDNDDTHAYVVPVGTTLAPGARLVLDEADLGFGLGATDAARLFDAAGALVDAYTWTVHASTSYGRCPEGTGAFATTANPTKAAANDCTVAPPTSAWPGRNAVVTADGQNVFGTNLSDIFYEPDVVWAVRNGPSTLFRLVWNGTIWTPDTVDGWGIGKTLRYPNGLGVPDGEGVTKAELGSSMMYVATERDNDVGGVSRLSILRFDTAQAGGELVATHEWNLNADIPAVGANLGLEAITWIPDVFLVANGFVDEVTGNAYSPASYANHGTGLFFVGVEATGAVYAYALDHVGGGFTRVATLVTGDASSKALYFDREVGYLWAHCGPACGNDLGVFGIDTAVGSPTRGKFKLRRRYARPTTMANLQNEGIAVFPESQCVNGQKPFLWTDDSATGGHSLRADTIPCAAFVP